MLGMIDYALRAITVRMYPYLYSEADINRLPKFGIFSVVFVGDSAQLPPVSSSEAHKHSLVSAQVTHLWND